MEDIEGDEEEVVGVIDAQGLAQEQVSFVQCRVQHSVKLGAAWGEEKEKKEKVASKCQN